MDLAISWESPSMATSGYGGDQLQLTKASHAARKAGATWEGLRARLKFARHTPSPGASTAKEERLCGSGSEASGSHRRYLTCQIVR